VPQVLGQQVFNEYHTGEQGQRQHDEAGGERTEKQRLELHQGR